MILRGQPDFQRPFRAEAEEVMLYFPFEQGSCFVLPDRLTLAANAQGTPDFRLSLVRGVMPALPPVPYGQVSFGLKTEGAVEKGLEAMRSLPPSANAGLNLAAYQRGFLRWRPMGNHAPLPAGLLTPSPLRFDGLATTQWSAVVPAESALLLKESQLDGLLVLSVVAELDIRGVAPRLPLRVRFDPHILVNEIVKHGASAAGQVPVEKMVAYFQQPVSKLPLQITGLTDNTPPVEWAETMRDLVRLRFGTLVPAADPLLTGPCVELNVPPPGEMVWDLSQPALVNRAMCLMLDPAATSRQLAQLTDPADYWQEVVVPALPTGQLPIRITANLPAGRANILSLGVTITAPPKLPFRPKAIQQTVELSAPMDQIDTFLRLSPVEPLEFKYQPFVIIDGPEGVVQLTGEEQSSGIFAAGSTCQLLLNPADFAVDFINLEAPAAMLSLAQVRARLEVAEEWTGEWISLDNNTPAAALAWPQSTPLPTLRIEASALDSPQIAVLPDQPFQSLRIGPELFKGYGEHQIDISYPFGDGTNLVAIELLPEDKDDLPANRSTIFLTPATPQKTWQYFAGSPFKPGFRYRFQSAGDVGEWSAVQGFEENSELILTKA